MILFVVIYQEIDINYMYRIPVLDSQVPINYANTYSAKLLPIIQSYLNGTTITVSVKNRGDVVVGVQRNTPTYKLLNLLSNPAYLNSYLMWDSRKQYKLIKKLAQLKGYPTEFIFKKLGAGVYDKENLVAQLQPIDHFNTIFQDIFVTQIYDSEANPAPFDKRDFISKTQLRVCPYCGLTIIEPSNRTKHQIDHFFPKGKYPFLALSYYNLIPSCDKCNESPNKGRKDPIEQNANGKLIQHPYAFNGSIVRFNLKLTGADIYDDNSYEVIVGFKDKALFDGYNLFFDISSRYHVHNVEAAPLYRSHLKFKKSKGYYKGMPIDRAWLDAAYEDLFNFDPSKNYPWSQEYFKMKVDIFKQLYHTRTPEPFYTDSSIPNTEMLD